jgi:hypothetical protein
MDSIQGSHQPFFPMISHQPFFPMIDLPPSDMSCVYSTLHFVCKEADRYMKTPIITFDQPLYWKAHQILSNEADESKLKNIVLRLGGFHLEMSFLGAVGHLMSGSGLQEILETVYAPNAVIHMLSGKAVSRAIRGHNIFALSLHAILLAKSYAIDIESFQSSTTTDASNEIDQWNDDIGGDRNADAIVAVNQELISTDTCPQCVSLGDSRDEALPQVQLDPDLEEACLLYDRLMAGEVTVTDVTNSTIFKDIHAKVTAFKSSLANKRIAKLWLIYLDMINLLHKFLEAERTGNWQMHLHTIRMMLPYLAAAGHNLYVKSVYVYLCEMQELEKNHPDVYAMFEAGHHVLRRSDRYWAGLSSDIVIEQVLMRSMKTSGGLTRGRGMTEFQRVQWLLSSPLCAEVNHAMQNLTGVDYHSSEQHKESGKTRRARDNSDAFKILRHITDRNPFEGHEQLRSIETGMMAEEKVNVDRCEDIGLEIINSLWGQSVSGYSYKRSKQAITLSTRTSIKVDDDQVYVDPQLLFQRLTSVARMLSVLFSYELSSQPSSLFDSSGFPREPQKSTLANAIWSLGDCAAAEIHPDRIHT